MMVRLVTKLAEVVNGVDLSAYAEGDLIELPARDAEMLIAERWAERVEQSARPTRHRWNADAGAVAADGGRRRRQRRR